MKYYNCKKIEGCNALKFKILNKFKFTLLFTFNITKSLDISMNFE